MSKVNEAVTPQEGTAEGGNPSSPQHRGAAPRVLGGATGSMFMQSRNTWREGCEDTEEERRSTGWPRNGGLARDHLDEAYVEDHALPTEEGASREKSRGRLLQRSPATLRKPTKKGNEHQALGVGPLPNPGDLQGCMETQHP